jgi:hypothetical protein
VLCCAGLSRLVCVFGVRTATGMTGHMAGSGRGAASQQRNRPPQRGAFAQHEACIRQDKSVPGSGAVVPVTMRLAQSDP